MGIYPFMFGTRKDFEPVVNELIEVRNSAAVSLEASLTVMQKDMREPYDWDAYAETFFPTAQELVRRAGEAEKAGENEKASELYL